MVFELSWIDEMVTVKSQRSKSFASLRVDDYPGLIHVDRAPIEAHMVIRAQT